MYNPYGTSGYQASHHFHSARHPEPKPHTKRKTWQRTLLLWASVILGVILVITWLFLGDFRFMMFRYPALSGFPFGSRTYIVLFQNNYELRPTGGFISTYGELTFSHGVYTGIQFHDVYDTIDDHEYVEPPLVLSALLEDDNYVGHTFRDANYDPDFTISRDALIDFYQITNPETQIDGVIAADFTFLEWMVGRYEPMNIEGYELTQENLFETLSTVVSDIDRHSEEALAERKNITSPIVKKIISKTIIFPWRAKGMLTLLAQGFEEKHVLASFTRSGLESSFAKRNWNGGMPQSDSGDFLAINEGNYGGMKSDRYMTRDVKYEISVTDRTDVLGNPIVNAKVTVTLSHEGTWNIPLSGKYTGYLRTMIPLGSEVFEGGTVEEKRDDSEVLGELVTLEPGESITYTYAYELPEYVWVDGKYYLHLHKQAGTDTDHYSVVVRVPQGMTLDAPLFDVRENVAFYDTDLLTDTNLDFTLLPDQEPPHIISHEITNLNEITILFNEQVSPDFAGDALNYEIADMDYADAETTDSIGISNIRVDGSAVIITTSGMTYQPDERYEVNMREIRDTNGNVITPSPRTVTVVQNEDYNSEDTTDENVEEDAADTSDSQNESDTTVEATIDTTIDTAIPEETP